MNEFLGDNKGKILIYQNEKGNTKNRCLFSGWGYMDDTKVIGGTISSQCEDC